LKALQSSFLDRSQNSFNCKQRCGFCACPFSVL
jgi:hypothetical protein